MRSITFILFLLFQLQALSQSNPKLVFRYSAYTQIPNEKDTFSLFYVIDSNIIFKNRKITFYKVTFSEDSVQNSGFIAIWKNGLLFIKDTLSHSKPQKIYSIGDKSKRKFISFPYVNEDVYIKQYLKADIIVLKLVYLIPRNSHSSYIKEIEFKKDCPYPQSITMFFPFEQNKNTKLFSSPMLPVKR